MLNEYEINKLKLNKVVQANALIQSTHKMTRNHLLLFKMVISALDTKGSTNQVKILKRDIFDLFNVANTAMYSDFKKEVRLVQTKAYLEMPLENDDIIAGFVIPTIIWHTKKDYVTFKLNTDFMPFLLNLKEYFTQYPLIEFSKLRSRYSMRIYELLQMKMLDEKLTSWVFTLDELKLTLDCADKYDDVRNFEKYVLKVAEKEINNKTNLFMIYEKIKKNGRKVSHIGFTVKRKAKNIPVGQLSINDVTNEKAFRYNWLEG